MTATTTLAPPAVGAPAPGFTLPSTDGSQVKLSAVYPKRMTLLAFFPLAFTSTCTTEVCQFSEDFGRYTEAGVTVLPISVDSVPTLREFKARYGIKVELLSDFRREVSRAYGVLHEERFHSKRAYFLIDGAGLVRWRHIEEKGGEMRSTDELLDQVARASA